MRSSDLILLVIPLPDKYIVPYPQELIDLIEYFDTATDEFDKVFPDPNSQDDPGFKEEVVWTVVKWVGFAVVLAWIHAGGPTFV